MGRITSSDTASRPKNLALDTAAAQSVPSMIAITVDMVAT